VKKELSCELVEDAMSLAVGADDEVPALLV
jgi:hypothetical protein